MANKQIGYMNGYIKNIYIYINKHYTIIIYWILYYIHILYLYDIFFYFEQPITSLEQKLIQK